MCAVTLIAAVQMKFAKILLRAVEDVKTSSTSRGDCRSHPGRACIRSMRIPVSVIVGQLAHGATTEDVLVDYPDLERADVQEALEYAAWLAQEEIVRA